MKKHVPVIALVAALLVWTLSMTAFAAEVPAVAYDGKNGTFTFQNINENGLFGAFQEVMPGDERTTEIRVEMKNISRTSRLYLRAEAVDGSNDALEALTLRVSQNGTVLDSGNGVRCLGSDVQLGTFSSSGGTTLEVTLSVPTEVGNDLAKQMGELKWIFTVQEEGGGSHDGTVTPPKTGDDGMLPYFVALLVSSGTALIILIPLMRKKQQEE